MMSGQKSVENNFKKLPKHEIMHKLWLVMWIDNGNFWFTCIQIGKMIGRLTNYSIHDFENICGHIRCSTSSFWEGYFEFFNCRTKRNRIRDISLAWQLNQTRFWCSKKKIKSKQWLTYDGWWTFCRLYSNIRGRHVVNHKSAAFHYFSSGQRLDIGCLVHIECPVCRDHIFWRNLDWLIKKDGTKYEMVQCHEEKLVEFASV